MQAPQGKANPIEKLCFHLARNSSGHGKKKTNDLTDENGKQVYNYLDYESWRYTRKVHFNSLSDCVF